jgi:hypothetical protein
MNLKKNLLLVLALLLTACGTSPRTNYFVLNTAATTMPGSAYPITIGIGPVTIAEYLDREAIVTRADNTLLVDELNRWGEPLAPGVTRVVMEELSSLLGSSLVAFPWRADEAPELRITLSILELNRQQQSANLKAAWSLIETGTGEKLHRAIENFEQPLTGPGYNQLVDAYSQLLQLLSQSIASYISQNRDQLSRDTLAAEQR